jgi:isochorismate hydrolase
VRQVIVGGVVTHVCPYVTAFDAFMNGYRVYYLADGTASLNRDLHVGALRNVAGWAGHVVSCGWVEAALAR